MTHRTVEGLPDAGKLHPYNHRERADDIVVDVIRPGDLVAVTVTVRGATLRPPPVPDAVDAHSVLVAGADASLVVDFPFQHAHEEASYQVDEGSEPDPRNPDGPALPATKAALSPQEPAQYRPARGSRLVFALRDGATIPYTTAGILEALPWLDAVLHPNAAAPGTRPPRYDLPGGNKLEAGIGIQVALGNGLFALLGDDGVQVTKKARAGTAVPDAETVVGMARLAANDRLVADVIRARGFRVSRGVDRAAITGRVGALLDPRLRPLPLRGSYSRRATLDETAIEAPFRLQVSPTSQGHWVHSSHPVAADDAPGHVELWHSRLDTGERTEENLLLPGRPEDDETRVIRAVWARDRDRLATTQWRDPTVDKAGGLLSPDKVSTANVDADPFLGSLDRADRHRIVRQTAETWPGDGSARLRPTPVGAERLWLTALGAWLELHGQWDTDGYSAALMGSVLAWDHVATGGRDQFVRVVYPGYLYPLGPPTVRVKITERGYRPSTNPTAGLFQRQFLAVIDPVRTHANPDFPLARTELRPLVTPSLDPTGDDLLPGLGADQAFWPRVGGKTFTFRVASVDRDGRPGHFDAPLVWVAADVGTHAELTALDDGYAQDPRRVIDLGGQTVAFVTKEDAGDARLETQQLRLRGTGRQGGSTPRLSSADVVLPAAQAIAGTGPTRITYYAPFRAGGFTGSNPGRVWAATVTGEVWDSADYALDLVKSGPAQDSTKGLPRIGFGGQPGDAGSDHAGGFVQPSLTIAGLSLVQGPVGDLATVATGSFDPKAFLGKALPKLFGLVDLDKLLDIGGLDEAPSLVTDALDTLSAIEQEVQRAVGIAADAVAQAQGVVDKVQGAGADAKAAGQQLLTDAQALAQTYADLAGALPGVIAALVNLDADQVRAQINTPDTGLTALLTQAADATGKLARPPLPLFSRTRLTQVAEALTRLAASADLADDIIGLLKGLDLAKKEVTFRYEWTPRMQSWPRGGPPLVVLKEDSLLLAVHGTLKASGPPSVEVLAELRNFRLHLFAVDPLIQIPFERMSFRSGSSGKAEVDVVMGDIVFGGFLSFVETIKELIPLDGFSDPPSVEVTPAGLTAGFSLTLPNLAIGVFSLSNMSLGADVRVPFLGETITVGFNFCSRERPFVLAVVFLGGGGWFLVRVSPKGLEVLELGLEAGAYLSVDFGVASGSISAAIGIYIRLEGKQGSLTGYFRLRGEVDVLGLISASIELYLELVYNFTTGKMVGRARITVEVEVLCFSASVSIEAERQFAGSNGDPSLRDVVMEDDGSAPAWDDYLLAFAPEEVAA